MRAEECFPDAGGTLFDSPTDVGVERLSRGQRVEDRLLVGTGQIVRRAVQGAHTVIVACCSLQSTGQGTGVSPNVLPWAADGPASVISLPPFPALHPFPVLVRRFATRGRGSAMKRIPRADPRCPLRSSPRTD